MIAAYKNNKMIAELLLSAGAKVNAEGDGQGRTALHVCAYKNNPEVAQLLLSYGADPMKVDASGMTAEQLAERRGHGEALETIKDFNRKRLGEAILNAAKWRRLEMLEELLKAGAPLDVEDNRGCTPLHWAAKRRFKAGCEVLLKTISQKHRNDLIDKKTKNLLFTPLMDCAVSGSAEVARLLLSYGAKVSEANAADETALSLASLHGNLEVVECLLEASADIVTCRALDNAALHRHRSILMALLKKAFEKLMFRSDLHAACMLGSAPAVEWLLEGPVDVEATDGDGLTVRLKT